MEGLDIDLKGRHKYECYYCFIKYLQDLESK